jgi:hypothetical protein
MPYPPGGQGLLSYDQLSLKLLGLRNHPNHQQSVRVVALVNYSVSLCSTTCSRGALFADGEHLARGGGGSNTSKEAAVDNQTFPRHNMPLVFLFFC